MVRSAYADQSRLDRKPAQRARRRGAPDCNLIAEKLAELAARLWRERWGLYYGGLGSVVGSASRKPITQRVGLMFVCVSMILANVAPPGARWDLSLTTDDHDQPVRLVMVRDELRHAVPVRLNARSLRVGRQDPVSLSGRDAGLKCIRAISAEAAGFFGSPIRSTGDEA